MDAPEWMTPKQQERFESLKGNWQARIDQILSEDDDTGKKD
jgi:hypothetical protein